MSETHDAPDRGHRDPDGLTPAELEAESAEALPERAAMSTLSVTTLDAATGTVEAVDGATDPAATTTEAPAAETTAAPPEATTTTAEPTAPDATTTATDTGTVPEATTTATDTDAAAPDATTTATDADATEPEATTTGAESGAAGDHPGSGHHGGGHDPWASADHP